MNRCTSPEAYATTFNTTNGLIEVAYVDTTEFKGNVSINNSKVTFNNSTGYVMCSGGTSQNFSGSADYKIGKLIMNKSASDVTLQRAVIIDSILTLTSGIIYTDSTNLLTLKSGGVVYGASDLSYIDGPMKKIGNTAFDFPIGINNRFMQFGLSATSNSSNQFIAEFFDNTQGLGNSLDSGLNSINACEYWKLTGGASGQTYTVTLSWDMYSCNIPNNSSKIVATWNGYFWTSKESDNITGNTLSGRIESDLTGNENYFLIGGNGSGFTIDSLDISGAFEEFGLLSGSTVISTDSILVAGSIGSINNMDSKILGDSVFQNGNSKVVTSLSDFYSVLESISAIDFDSTVNLSNGFYTLTKGKYLITGSDTLNGTLFLEGDSTDKFILVIDQNKYLSGDFIIRHKDVRPKNICIVSYGSLTMDDEFKFKGILFSNDLNITSLPGGKYSLISPSSINFANADLNYFRSLSSFNTIELLVPYTCTNTGSTCNLISNPGFEAGSMPTDIEGVLDYYCDCWSAESFVKNICSIRTDNTPDYYDVLGITSQPGQCLDAPEVGIPNNHVGTSTNVRVSNTDNHIHLLSSEEIEGELSSSFDHAPFIISAYYSPSDCANSVTGDLCLT